MSASDNSLSNFIGTQSPDCAGSSDVAGSAVCQTPLMDAVSGLTDDEREDAIARAGELMVKRYGDWGRTGCFAALGDAHRACELQKKLIAGRSAEVAFLMEAKRGLL